MTTIPHSLGKSLKEISCGVDADASIRDALAVGELGEVSVELLIALEKMTLDHDAHQMIGSTAHLIGDRFENVRLTTEILA